MQYTTYSGQQELLFFPRGNSKGLSLLFFIFPVGALFYYQIYKIPFFIFLLMLMLSAIVYLAFINYGSSMHHKVTDCVTHWTFNDNMLFINYSFQEPIVQNFDQLVVKSLSDSSSQEYSFVPSCINYVYWCEDLLSFIILYNILDDPRIDNKYKCSQRLSNVPYTINCPSSCWQPLSKLFLSYGLYVRQSGSDYVANSLHI